MNRVKAVVIALILCSLASFQQASSSDFSPQFKGAYPGIRRGANLASAMVMRGSNVWMAAYESGAHIFNIENPADPFRIAGVGASSSYSAIAFKNNYAFLLAGSSGLQVFDVSDPNHPVQRGSPVGYFNQSGGIALTGDVALVASGSLIPIDISDIFNLQITNVLNGPGIAQSVTISGTNAFVPAYTGGLWIVDITDPEKPSLTSTITLGGTARKVAVKNEIAYVANLEKGLQIIDVANPHDPKVIAGLTNLISYDVVVSGNFAFATDWAVGVRIIDISNPTSPQIVATATGLVNPSSLALNGSQLIVGSIGGALEVFDISDSLHPARLGVFDPCGETRAIDIKGNYAYLAENSGGLKIIDITNRAQPRRVGEVIPLGAQTKGVAVEGNYAYVAADWNGLEVYDVSDPRNPVNIAVLSTAASAIDVTVAAGFAYVTEVGIAVEVIDVHTPTKPARRTAIGLAHPVRTKIVGDRLFVITVDEGVQIYSIAQAGSPALLGSVFATVGEVGVSGNLLYVGESDALRIFDITDPARPQMITLFDFFRNIGSVAVSGDFCFMSCEYGLVALDVSDPRHPRWFGRGFAGSSRMEVIGGDLFMNSFAGMAIFDLPIFLESNSADATDRTFRVQSLKNITGRLQRATQLGRWTDWKTIQLGGPEQQFTDPDATSPAAFMRFVSP